MFKTVYLFKGIILIDVLLAFSLSILFIILLSDISLISRQTFEKAKEKKELLDLYDAGIKKTEIKLYGNDLFEKIISVGTSSNLSFVEIFKDDSKDLTKFRGTPLCSADYLNGEIIGSYGYFNFLKDQFNSSNISIDELALPINPSLPLTDLEVRNNTAYISADSTIASDPDFLVFDLKEGSNPKLISSINTGPGLVSIALAGKRIFAAAPSTVAELHVIRMDNLSNLILENKYKLPLPYATATPALGSSIFFYNNNIFLGTEKWNGEEFNIIDVSRPELPLKIGGFEIGSKVSDIFISDKLAYVAGSDQKQLRIIDINDIFNLKLLNSFSPAGWQRQEGKAVSFFEDGLNFGRTSGGFNFADEYEFFNWQSSSSTTLDNPIFADFAGGIYGIIGDRKNLFLITHQKGREFQVFNRETATSTVIYSLLAEPKILTCDGDYLYILGNTPATLYRINFFNNG